MEKEYEEMFNDPDDLPCAYHTDEIPLYLSCWKEYGRQQGMKHMFIVMEGGGGAITPAYAHTDKYIDKLRQLLWIGGHVIQEEKL